jgi:ABC-type lipoprotein release transport system permease subunit
LFRSGQNEYDRSAIHMPLSYFREVYFMRGAIHKVVGVCDSLWDVGDAKKSIKNALEKTDLKKPLVVKDWNDLMPGLLQSIKMDLVSGIIFYILLIILVAFSILNTFLMAIFERTREFGVMMALGTTPKRLMKLLLTESIFMTAVGIAAGIVLGVGFTLYFETHGLAIGSSEILKQFGIPGKIYPMLTIPSLAAGPVLVFIITILAALYPTLKVRKLNPVEAMTFT